MATKETPVKKMTILIFLILLCLYQWSIAGPGGWRTVPDRGSMNSLGYPILSTPKAMFMPTDFGIARAVITPDKEIIWRRYAKTDVWPNMAVCASDQYIYFSGGHQTLQKEYQFIDTIKVFTLKDKLRGWLVKTGQMKTPREFHETLVIKDKLYVFGGIGKWNTYYSSVEFTSSDPQSTTFGVWDSAPSFKKIMGPVVAVSRERNKVICLGVRLDRSTGERLVYLESSDIHSDGTLGEWSVLGGPYEIDFPVGAVFRPDRTLFVVGEYKDNMNKCYIMDLKKRNRGAPAFVPVAPLDPGVSVFRGDDLGVGCWDRFVCFVTDACYIYDPNQKNLKVFRSLKNPYLVPMGDKK